MNAALGIAEGMASLSFAMLASMGLFWLQWRMRFTWRKAAQIAHNSVRYLPMPEEELLIALGNIPERCDGCSRWLHAGDVIQPDCGEWFCRRCIERAQ